MFMQMKGKHRGPDDNKVSFGMSLLLIFSVAAIWIGVMLLAYLLSLI